ncbi:hypothetical protein WISP_38604 [Willisornis vidua]|uniref:Uncharacterized protein n=1 Tax=Willisornis vidua TaxID=1566151 RepID=A0ABQ9DIC6_9PASS|nr:hypothetical protein WISP_38604 [Willisornis vidua]
MTSKSRTLIITLYSAVTRSHLEYDIQLWVSQQKKHMDVMEQVQRRDTKIIRVLEHLSDEDKLKELVLFSLEERSLQGNLRVTFQYLKEACKKDEE